MRAVPPALPLRRATAQRLRALAATQAPSPYSLCLSLHSQVTIFKKAGLTKFKIRCSKYLYTLCMRDADKVRCCPVPAVPRDRARPAPPPP